MPMLFREQWSDAIENAGEPYSVIASFPDIAALELPSVNHLDPRGGE
jgi:hypothetical protein